MSGNRRNRSSSIGFFKSLYLTNRFFGSLAILVFLSVVCFIFPSLFIFLQILILLFIILVAIDCLMLYRQKEGIKGERVVPNRLSNGDENQIVINVTSNYPFATHAQVIEELPFQFQERDVQFSSLMPANETKEIVYALRPTERGDYHFGFINVYVNSKLSLLKRRYMQGAEQQVPVYPSFLEINQYELLAVSNRLTDLGVKRIRRVGNATEFEHIKSYVIGDDTRTINYKATARNNELMVNTYMEERAQSVYCLIDKGRTMQMPFEGLSLLDYAINSSLVVSTTALKKGDKAGLITFSNAIDNILPASDRRIQRSRILETLYKQQTDFKESSYSGLFLTVKRSIRQRSLLVLFTNFETLNSLQRQMKYLKLLAKDHLLLVAFFSNTEMDKVLEDVSESEEDFFKKGIAEKMHSDKNLIVKELNRFGIHTVLTPPEQLSIHAINKYLEIKTRGLI